MGTDPQPYLALMARLAGAGLFVQSLEVMWNWREMREDGLLGWRPARANGLKRLAGRLHAFPLCGWWLGLRALLAALAITGACAGEAGLAVSAALVALQLWYNRRFTMIAGNCETLFLIDLVAVLTGTLPEASHLLRSAALAFVTAHVAIAYAMAGIDKLRSHAWRDGSRLLQVVRDSSYSLPAGAVVLERRPGLTRTLTWTVLALELLLPVAVFLPMPVFVALLAGGLCFHLTVAIVMGLHGFWWSFAAAYPALWFTHEWLLA